MTTQIAKIVFLNSLSTMKSILSLLEFKLGKNTDDYKYVKKQIMDSTYNNLKKLFKQLQDDKLIIKCSCNSKIRQGYSDCEYCSGAGYKNI